MRISIRPSSKNADSIYIIKDLYLRDVRGKKSAGKPSGKDRTTVTVANLGKIPDLMASMNMTRDEVIAWAKEEARRMTEKEKKDNERVSIDYFPNLRIEKDILRHFNCGYLFLQSLYYELRMDNVCRNISFRHDFKYSLDSILSDLIYARIRLFWNRPSIKNTMSTELFPFWLKKMTTFNPKYIRTVILF